MKDLKKKVKVYFAGVDDWDRPTFRAIFDKTKYYCDIYKLFDYDATEEKILSWYSLVGTSAILYKGSRFDSEPMGSPADVEIVTRAEAVKMLTE